MPTLRSVLSASLTVLLFAPMLVGGHAHVADHDGGEHHVDTPHGAHEVVLADGREQIPSTPLGLILVASPAPGFSGPQAASVVRLIVDDAWGVAPARGPPQSVRSRAPPLHL